MPIADLPAAAKQTADLLRTLITAGGFRLKFRIVAGEGARDPSGLEDREIYVELAGPDAELLTARKGELLRSFEHIAAKSLHLEPDEHDKVSFDANQFKAQRAEELQGQVRTASERVRETGKPYIFPSMNSRERRLVHLAFRDIGDMRTESSGEGPQRSVVVYPKDYSGRPIELRDDDRRGFRGRGKSGFGNRGGGGGNNRGGGGNRGGGRGRY